MAAPPSPRENPGNPPAGEAGTSSAAFFEAKYRQNADPWNFAGSPYELDRYRRIVAALQPGHFRRAFEPACSVGVLTALLATFCDAVEACDFSETAVAQARARCAALPGVQITCEPLQPQNCARFDLLVLSEVGYYFELDVWRALVHTLTTTLAPGSTVLGSHWLGVSSDHRHSGDQVHEVLRAEPNLRLEHAERLEGFRLDRFVRV